MVAKIVEQASNPDDSPQILKERARRAKKALEYNGESSSSEESNETDTDESDSELPENEMGSAVSPGSGSSGESAARKPQSQAVTPSRERFSQSVATTSFDDQVARGESLGLISPTLHKAFQ